MRKRVPILLTGLICLAAGYSLNSPWVSAASWLTSISAIPNQKGGQDDLITTEHVLPALLVLAYVHFGDPEPEGRAGRVRWL